MSSPVASVSVSVLTSQAQPDSVLSARTRHAFEVGCALIASVQSSIFVRSWHLLGISPDQGPRLEADGHSKFLPPVSTAPGQHWLPLQRTPLYGRNTCEVNDHVTCPYSGVRCSGNQCCPGAVETGGKNFVCPSASSLGPWSGDIPSRCQLLTKIE